MLHYALPLLNLLINGTLLYFLISMLSSYFEFEYFVAVFFFLFYILVSVNALFKHVFSFMTKHYTFNLLFIVQFCLSILIIQPLGWIFSIYLAFVLMLLYLIFTKQNAIYAHFLELSGIVVGGAYLYITFFG
jgi:hypothetical protein